MDIEQIINPSQDKLAQESIQTIKNLLININHRKIDLKFQGHLQYSPINYALQLQKEQKTLLNITCTYQNTVSFGINKEENTLICFMGDQEEDDDDEQPSDQQSILAMVLKDLNTFVQLKQEKCYNLNGRFIVSINFKQNSLEKLVSTYQSLSQFLKSDQDENQLDDSDDDGLGQMISADNIDENGEVFVQQDDQENEQLEDKKDKSMDLQ